MALVLFDPNGRKAPNLDTLPVELFRQVVSHLDPVWMYNLSHSFRRAWHLLSFAGGGNRLWYNAMPPAMWMEEEGHQNEFELLNARLAKWSLENHPTLPMPNYFYIGPSPHIPLLSVLPHARGSGTVPTLTWPPAHPNPIEPRSHNILLGGEYQSGINYRREIIGRMMSGRCHICFSTWEQTHRDPDDQCIVLLWGLNWCIRCLMALTISEADLGRIVGQPDDYPTVYQVLFLETMGMKRFFIPGVEAQLRKLDKDSLECLRASCESSRWTVRVIMTLGSDSERQRRVIRRLIVSVAERIWSGRSLGPVFARAGRIFRGKSELGPNFPGRKKYKWYRDRYAPVEKLKGFLFPDYLLSDDPTSAVFDLGDYLTDPTKEMFQHPSRMAHTVTNFSIIMVARSMVEDLVTISTPQNRLKNKGNKVTTWVNAAKEWQRQRLIQDVLDGGPLERSTDEIDTDPENRPNVVMLLGTLLGLLDPFTGYPSRIPDYPDLSKYHGEASDTLVRDYSAYKTTETRLRKNTKLFNSILLEKCIMCPMTRSDLSNEGLDAILEHMISNHPHVFFKTDGFFIDG